MELNFPAGDSASEMALKAETGEMKNEFAVDPVKTPSTKFPPEHPGGTGIATAQTGLGTAEHLQAIEDQRAMKVSCFIIFAHAL